MKDLVILHMDSHVVFGSVEEDVLLIVKDVDSLVNNSKTTSPFYASSSYKAVKSSLTDLRELCSRHSSLKQACFQSCTAVKLQATQGPLKSVKAQPLDTMRIFENDLRDKKNLLRERRAI